MIAIPRCRDLRISAEAREPPLGVTHEGSELRFALRAARADTLGGLPHYRRAPLVCVLIDRDTSLGQGFAEDTLLIPTVDRLYDKTAWILRARSRRDARPRRMLAGPVVVCDTDALGLDQPASTYLMSVPALLRAA